MNRKAQSNSTILEKTSPTLKKQDKTKYLCRFCHREGHKIFSCRYKRRKEQAQKNKQEKQKLKSEANFKQFIANQLKSVTKQIEYTEDISASITHAIESKISSMLKENVIHIVKEFTKLILPFQKFALNHEKDEESCPNNQQDFNEQRARHQLHSERKLQGDGGGGDGVVSCNSPPPSSPEVLPHHEVHPQSSQHFNYHDPHKKENEEKPCHHVHHIQQSDHQQDEEQPDHHEHLEEHSQEDLIDPQDASLCSYCEIEGHEFECCELRIQHLEEKVAKLEKQNKDYETAEFDVYQNKKGKKVLAIEFENVFMTVSPKLSKIDNETPSKIRSKRKFRRQFKPVDKQKILIHHEVYSHLSSDHSGRGEKN